MHVLCACCIRHPAPRNVMHTWRSLPTHYHWMYCTVAHEQKAHGLKSIGVAKKTVFEIVVGLSKWFKAQWRQFFSDIDNFIELMSHSDVWIWLSGDFCDDDSRWQTNPIALPLAHAHGVITWGLHVQNVVRNGITHNFVIVTDHVRVQLAASSAQFMSRSVADSLLWAMMSQLSYRTYH